MPESYGNSFHIQLYIKEHNKMIIIRGIKRG